MVGSSITWPGEQKGKGLLQPYLGTHPGNMQPTPRSSQLTLAEPISIDQHSPEKKPRRGSSIDVTSTTTAPPQKEAEPLHEVLTREGPKKSREVFSALTREATNGRSPYKGFGTQQEPYIVEWLVEPIPIITYRRLTGPRVLGCPVNLPIHTNGRNSEDG